MSKKTQELLDTLKTMRLISNSTGMVYDLQADNLQKVSKLFFGDLSVVISVITDSWNVVAQLPPNAKAPANSDKFVAMVQSLLGSNWKVQIVNGQPRQDNPKPNPRRARGARTVSKRNGRKRRTRS